MAKKKDKYGEKIDSIGTEHNGLRVELVLQQRLDNPPGQPYHCLRWWTYLPEHPATYRRFYRHKGKFWTIPVQIALPLIQKAGNKGMLSDRYDGVGVANIMDSRELTFGERRNMLSQIVCDAGEPDWGDNPVFVISEDNGAQGIWREIMIVDSAAGFCSFRSTTTLAFTDYKFAANAPGIYPPWRIDKAMQEVTPAAMREFLHVLEEISQ